MKKKVYACFSTDVIHCGHLNIIKKASELGELTVGVLADEAIASYKRYPLISLESRMEMFRNLRGVSNVVVQESLDYTRILSELKPDYVVHGDEWRIGFQAGIRQKVIEKLKEWQGELIEFPYSPIPTETQPKLDKALYMPEYRRSRLKKLLEYKGHISVLEAHNGLTGLIVENTHVEKKDGVHEFDAMWVSSLCDSTAKGKPDIELVDMSSRIHTLEEIMDVTTKPIILDGDTGGAIEHFVFNIRTLERIGISAIIIEDKIGSKRNSLFGTEAEQVQDEPASFCRKIRAGKDALKTKDFMIIARCESLILGKGLDDAINRCIAYVEAGADGIMIHSCKETPDEVLEFCRTFRKYNRLIPIVVVPTTYNCVTEDILIKNGANIIIYANHLIRSAFPAMQKTAQTILEYGRSLEAEKYCMGIKQILSLIPDR